MNEKVKLTRRDAIEWLCYGVNIRYPKYVPGRRKYWESLTTEQITNEYNKFVGKCEIVDSDEITYPVPTPEERAAALERISPHSRVVHAPVS